MNRIEFMTRLAALLQDVPVAERRDAMKYYNDYFDDAGAENEQEVISELESPEKVAATIKADLGIQAGESQRQEYDGYAEYTENGYKDTRFERKEMPAGRTGWNKNTGNAGNTEGMGRSEKYRQEYYEPGSQEPPRTSKTLKILLIIAIIVVGIPVIIPVVFGVGAAVLACVLGIFILFAALVIASVALAIAGIALFFAGIWALVPEIAVGLALIGTGLILGVIGVILTVVSVRLCIVAIPGICRGLVWICRRPFQGRAVA